MKCGPLLVGFLAALPALAAAECQGPADIERAVKSHPTADGYNALGAWFGHHHQPACAVSSFNKALALRPDSWEAHYNLGIAFIQNNQRDRAISELAAAIQRKPDAIAARNALGTALQDSGQLDRAAAEFKAAIKLDPKSVYALDRLAEIDFAQQRYAPAIELWEQAIHLAPTDPELRIKLAVAYSSSGDSNRAIGILTGLLKSAPDLAAAHFNLATVYAREKRFREAANEYRSVLRIEPSNDAARLAVAKAEHSVGNDEAALPFIQAYARRHAQEFEAQLLLGNVYRGLGRYADAEGALLRAVQMNAGDYETRYALGFVLARERKPRAALPQLQKALEIRPDSSESKFQLAGVLKSLNRTEEAKSKLQDVRKEKQQSVASNVAAAAGAGANQLLTRGDAKQAAERYREALKLNPKDAKTWFNLSLALDDLGENAEERAALERAVALDGSMGRAQNRLGLLDAREGKTADAEEHFKKAIELAPTDAEAQTNLGVLYGRLGRTQEAERLLGQAIENAPRFVQAYVNLGALLANEGRLNDAASELQKAVQISPDDIASLTALGILQGKLGKASEAAATLRHAADLDPNSAEAHLNLGIALADRYNLESALDEFSKAEKLAPDSASPHFNRGRVLVDLGRQKEAQPELEMACRLAPSYAPSFYLLALTQQKLDQFDEAVATLNKLLLLDPRNARAHYLLGENLQRLGKTEQAVVSWKKAIDLDPSQSEALYNLWRALSRTEPEEAKQYRERFAAQQRDKQITTQAETLANFAIGSAKSGDYPRAISQLREAVRQCGDCASKADLHKDLGLIECRSGDVRNGEKDLLFAKQFKPQDPDILKALDLIRSSRGESDPER
jgi:tetratricopeptide (TPR) repeat protein